MSGASNNNGSQKPSRNKEYPYPWVTAISAVVTIAVGLLLKYLVFSDKGQKETAYVGEAEEVEVVDPEDSLVVEEAVAEVEPDSAYYVSKDYDEDEIPSTPYSPGYWLAGTFTDQYGVERPVCLELEGTTIDNSPRGKIHNLNANAGVFVTRQSTSSAWIYSGTDRGHRYTLTIPRGSSFGEGAVLNIDGNRADVSFFRQDYSSPRSAATASTNQAKNINDNFGRSKVNDGYYAY